MDRIHGVPLLNICEKCRKHGEIYFPISGTTYVVLSKEQAYKCISEEKEACAVLPSGHVFSLFAQILDSDIPEFMDDESEHLVIQENVCAQNSIMRLAQEIFGEEKDGDVSAFPLHPHLEPN